MRQRLLDQVGKPARLRVLNELKRTAAGLPVRDLAERIGMSYMGVKDICVDLAKGGLLETWRQPVKTGRPLMLYRLTMRAHELFPASSNRLTLELLNAAQKLFGATAPEKLLLVTFQQRTEAYASQIRGETWVDRAASLAKLREKEGCMSEFQQTAEGKCQIVEHHSPILEVLRAFPIVGKFEAEMFERLLGVHVRREEMGVSGLFCAIFYVEPDNGACNPEGGEGKSGCCGTPAEM